MTPDDWRQAMLAEAEAVQDEGWSAQTRRVARDSGWLGWSASVGAVLLLAALTLWLGPNLNPGGWGVHSNVLLRWVALAQPPFVLLAGFYLLGTAFALTRLGVRPAVVVLVFMAFPLALDVLGALVYPPAQAVRGCVLDALRVGCFALDRFAAPLPAGVWNAGAAGLAALLGAVGANWAGRRLV